jgi:hypothetical protein
VAGGLLEVQPDRVTVLKRHGHSRQGPGQTDHHSQGTGRSIETLKMTSISRWPSQRASCDGHRKLRRCAGYRQLLKK